MAEIIHIDFRWTSKETILPPYIIEPDALHSLMQTEELLLVDLSNMANYDMHHLPGAVHISPQEIVSGTKPATGKLPNIERLDYTFL